MNNLIGIELLGFVGNSFSNILIEKLADQPLEFGIKFLFPALCLQKGFYCNMLIYTIFLILLGALTIVDLKYLLIPDIFILFLVILGVIWRLWIQDEISSAIVQGVLLSGMGAALAYAFKCALDQLALGMGDIKLLFVCGLWLEFENLPMFLILSGSAGLVSGLIWFSFGYGRRFPFGPSLALALVLTVDPFLTKECYFH